MDLRVSQPLLLLLYFWKLIFKNFTRKILKDDKTLKNYPVTKLKVLTDLIYGSLRVTFDKFTYDKIYKIHLAIRF